KLGSSALDEGQIYLESNVWAVISGAADREQAVQAMDSVHEHLATEHGVALCEPPHTKPVPGLDLSLLVYPPSHKENGGIFCHSNSWTIVAEALLGRGDRAYEYYRSYLPAKYNDSAEIHQAEPYVYTQFVYGKHAPHFGQARNPWLTGTASWTYVAVTQYLLGIKPALDGLRIDPAIPSAWDGYSVRRRFRGTWVTVNVSNPDRVSSGVASLSLDGVALPGDVVPASALRPAGPDDLDVNIVTVVLGAKED
ncbi:MAG TPA: glycosyl hydrolase family 65 protein, partial [Actinoplanes sp.]|nr:glycosyl hydrolase family 65 protein [Actinoplanes sp.]